MAIRLIIFDLDGTLVDSSTDIATALNTAGKIFGVSPVTVREAEGLIGGGLTALIDRLLAKEGINVDRTALLKGFLDTYSSHLTDHTRPYPRVTETLVALDGIAKAVLSNKTTSFTVEIVRRFGWTGFFESIQGGDTIAEKKPAPTAVLNLLADFKVRKEEAIIVGDSLYDVEAGRSAGIHTVAVLYGYGSPGFDAKADFRVRAFEELLPIVQRLDNRA
jgi:phosphoglycolate phosphatase